MRASMRPIAPVFGRELDTRATIVGVPARQNEGHPPRQTNACRNGRGRMSIDFPPACFRGAIARNNVNANLTDSPSSVANSCASSNPILPHLPGIEDVQAGIGMIKSVASPWASAMHGNFKSTEPKLYRPT
jgi:hypothetical protein